MSTIMEMAEVHAVRIAERDATIASQAAEIEAYKHEAEVYREIKIEYEILLARSQREAAEIEWLRGAISDHIEAHDWSAVDPIDRGYPDVDDLRAALQPKEGE